ncbi:hypothetical protein [Desulfomarina sp.]
MKVSYAVYFRPPEFILKKKLDWHGFFCYQKIIDDCFVIFILLTAYMISPLSTISVFILAVLVLSVVVVVRKVEGGVP